MRNVYGCQCSLTLLQDGVYTAIPYVDETIRSTPLTYSLKETVGKKKRNIQFNYGFEVSGCFVTRLSNASIIPLLKLLQDPEKPFDLLIDRVTEKIIYRNISVKTFELRANAEAAVYLKIEVNTTTETYTQDFSVNTPVITWEKENTFLFEQKGTHAGFLQSTLALEDIYKFSFTADYEKRNVYKLQLHKPLDISNRIGSFSWISNITFISKLQESTLRIDFESLTPTTSLNETDTFGEQLVTRKYAINGSIHISFRTSGKLFEVTL